jgi:lipoprotein-anchoring transpeptidase ErfK/SrfK
MTLALMLGGLMLVAQGLPPVDVDLPTLELQVRLDRAGFSPGEIDAADGDNTRRAIEAYARARNLPDADTSTVAAALAQEQPAPALASYSIAEADVRGPFTPHVPADLEEQAKLPVLAFRNPLESLAEKLHVSPALLERLNPGARFAAGETITAPNVVTGQTDTPGGPVTVRVSESASSLRVEGPDGTVLMHAPVTTGSAHDPLPLGEWKVTTVLWSPKFYYNPELFWDADPTHAKAVIPAGPNNPVGVVWVDLNKPHYGLHGTPEPSRIGKTESHGCVRLTNWDAARLAALVQPGTPVIFEP